MAIVMRKAVLMEDEGRETFVGQMPLAEAVKWVESQNDYFYPADFRIVPDEKEKPE